MSEEIRGRPGPIVAALIAAVAKCFMFDALPLCYLSAAIPQSKARNILRKEVIQPQVPLRLPCYDFTPVAELTVVGCLLLRGWRTAFG